MKKIVLIGLLILFPFFLRADNVKSDRAYSVASSFFRHSPQTRSSDVRLQMVWDGENPVRSLVEAPAFYVFNNTEGLGYVIVAGDDLAQPILGYSFTSNINARNMPVAFVRWMEGIREEIRHARTCGMKQDDVTAQKWKIFEEGSHRLDGIYDLEVSHQTAQWDQAAPYWDECPEIPNKDGELKRTFTGCLITAACILMKYNAWPVCGTGTIPSYVTKNQRAPLSVPVRTLGHKYAWDNMLLSYYDGFSNPVYTPEQGAEVARLMADVGAALQADYGIGEDGGTGGFVEAVPDAFSKYFSYDKSMHVEYRHFYKSRDWNEKMKKELKAGPVLYCGQAKSGGHAFVLDGYDKFDFFQVNWGWGGISNGLFKLNALDPSFQGAGGADSGFNNNQSALVSFKKDVGGQAAGPVVGIVPLQEDVYDYKGIRTTVTDYEMGKPFLVSVGAFLVTQDFIGEIVLAVADRMDKVKQVLAVIPEENIKSGYYYFLNNGNKEVVINQPIVPGDKLKTFYRAKDEKEYHPVLGDSEHVVMEIILRKDVMEKTIAYNTSFEYNRNTRLVKLNIPTDTQFKLESEGKDLTGKCSVTPTDVTIDAGKLEPGTYLVILTRQGEVKRFKFKL